MGEVKAQQQYNQQSSVWEEDYPEWHKPYRIKKVKKELKKRDVCSQILCFEVKLIVVLFSGWSGVHQCQMNVNRKFASPTLHSLRIQWLDLT